MIVVLSFLAFHISGCYYPQLKSRYDSTLASRRVSVNSSIQGKRYVSRISMAFKLR